MYIARILRSRCSQDMTFGQLRRLVTNTNESVFPVVNNDSQFTGILSLLRYGLSCRKDRFGDVEPQGFAPAADKRFARRKPLRCVVGFWKPGFHASPSWTKGRD